MNRRDFLSSATLTTSALALGGCNESDRQAIDYSKHPQKNENNKSFNVNKNRKTVIRLATSWPAHFPIMGEGVEEFVKRVEMCSSGSIEIKLYPKNTLIPALAVFDAASSSQIDAFHSGPYYWKGKNPAFSLFSGVPFGFTAEEINSWMIYGDGLTLWRELYAKHNLHPLLGGNTNIQMGGWFRKKINSLEDMQGLKMRVPGLGGEVFSKMGVNPILLPAGEIYTSLERGVIDATEWVGPALDLKMGFYRVAQYYYSGWHEPGSVLELTFNKAFWDKLPNEHKSILEVSSSEMNANMTYNFHAQNTMAMEKIEELGIKIESYPKDVISAAKIALEKVVQEQSMKSGDFKRVYENASAYLKKSIAWSDVSLKDYLNMR